MIHLFYVEKVGISLDTHKISFHYFTLNVTNFISTKCIKMIVFHRAVKWGYIVLWLMPRPCPPLLQPQAKLTKQITDGHFHLEDNFVPSHCIKSQHDYSASFLFPAVKIQGQNHLKEWWWDKTGTLITRHNNYCRMDENYQTLVLLY